MLDGHVPAYERVAVDALTSELDLSHRLEEFNDASLPPGMVGTGNIISNPRHNAMVISLMVWVGSWNWNDIFPPARKDCFCLHYPLIFPETSSSYPKEWGGGRRVAFWGV